MDGITIVPIDAKAAPEAELRRLNDFINSLNHEAWPDDAPSSFEAFKTRIDTTPPFHRRFRWIARRGDAPVVKAPRSLDGVFPNPFHARTSLRFHVERNASAVRVEQSLVTHAAFQR